MKKPYLSLISYQTREVNRMVKKCFLVVSSMKSLGVGHALEQQNRRNLPMFSYFLIASRRWLYGGLSLVVSGCSLRERCPVDGQSST